MFWKKKVAPDRLAQVEKLHLNQMHAKAPNGSLARGLINMLEDEEVKAVCKLIVNKAIKWNESIYHVATFGWLHLCIQFVCIYRADIHDWFACHLTRIGIHSPMHACMHACIVILMRNAIRIALECTNGNCSIKCHLTSCLAPYTKRTITIHDFNLLTRQMVFIWKCLEMQKKKKNNNKYQERNYLMGILQVKSAL